MPSNKLQPKSPLEEKILQALAEVKDPAVGVGVVEMNWITKLEADPDGVVRFTFRPPSNICSAAFELGAEIMDAIESVDGVEEVFVEVENHERAAEIEAALNGEA